MEEFVKKKDFDNFKNEVDKRLNAIEEPIKEIQITSAKTLEKLENMDKNNDLKNQIIEEKINTKIEPLKKDIISNSKDIDDIKNNNQWLWRTIAGAIIVTIIGAFISILK